MKVTYTQNLIECTFDDIKIGECFEYAGKVFFRIPFTTKNSMTVNAVNLGNLNSDASDCLFCISDQSKVYPVSTELKVTYKCEEVK